MVKIRQFLHYRKHRNSKVLFYIKGYIRYGLPCFLAQVKTRYILSAYNRFDQSTRRYIHNRVNYYNKLNQTITVPGGPAVDGSEMIPLSMLKLGTVFNGRRSNSAYVLDTHEVTRFFNQKYKAAFLFGDITHVPQIPSFVKSRPIAGNNSNSVLLKLDKTRHFTFVKDNRRFSEKRDMLIGRTYVDQPHRKKFWEMYFNHPLCDLGNINRKLTDHPEWLVAPMAIDDHLDYKFILCLEGNDVASNLKWVMSSNSLAVMPRPTYETWFMEGCLIPNYHYVEIKDDFSDLEEQLSYYIYHPEEAQKIIDHAHKYVDQFRNKKQERLISLMVADKYFVCTGQVNISKPENYFSQATIKPEYLSGERTLTSFPEDRESKVG